jgi:hypothetical protein
MHGLLRTRNTGFGILPSGANGYCVIESVPRRNSGTGPREPGNAKAARSVATALKQGWGRLDGAPATGEYDLTPNTGATPERRIDATIGVEHARSAERKYLTPDEIGKDQNLYLRKIRPEVA